MNTLRPYHKPNSCQRLKIALHYLLPQLLLTRLAGWLAERRWGKITHLFIATFAKLYRVNWQEAVLHRPSDYACFNDFFIRRLKEGTRPLAEEQHTLCLPADGKISEAGAIHHDRLLQAKGHSFTLSELLGNDVQLASVFENGTFITTYLSPRDYHRVHMPCDATLCQMIYVPGELFSVNPFLAEHIPNLFARNERLICVFETEFGKMVQILVGATITASISTVWAGVINPPRSSEVRVWHYPTDGEQVITLKKGEEMGAFRLGSTVINLFPANTMDLDSRLIAGCETKVGEIMGLIKTA